MQCPLKHSLHCEHILLFLRTKELSTVVTKENSHFLLEEILSHLKYLISKLNIYNR